MSNQTISSALDSLLQMAIKVEILPNTRYFLTNPGMVWFVGSETSGDIFAWEKDNENFIPQFLLDANPGEMIFGASLDSSEEPSNIFYYICSKPTILYMVSLNALRATLHLDPDASHFVANQLERWTGRLLTHLTRTKATTGLKEFAIGSSTSLTAGEKAKVQFIIDPERKERVAWIELLQGTVAWAGNSLLTLTPEEHVFYPMTFFFWIEAVTDAKVACHTTLEAIERNELWDGIYHLHRKIFPFFDAQKLEDEKLAAEKSKKKREVEAETTQESIYTLGSLFESKLAYVPSKEGGALFNVCDQIGQLIKVKMVPASGTFATAEDEVREIANYSSVFYRKISLKEKWWENCLYPLVGFYGEKQTPVALINISATKFQFLNPETMKKELITSTNASQFSPTAFVFHPSLNEPKVTFFKMMKFAYREAGKESFVFLILAILSGLVNLYMPFAMKTLFDSLTATANIHLLVQLTIGAILAALSLWIFSITKAFAVQRFNGISNNKLMLGLWGRVLNFPVSFFRQKSVGEQINQFESVVAVHSTINDYLVSSFFSTIYAIFYFIQMITFSPILSLTALISFLVPIAIFCVSSYFEVVLFKRIIELSGVIEGYVIQLLAGLSKIRVAGAESRFFKIWSGRFAEKKRAYLRYQKVAMVTSFTSSIFPLAATVVMYAIALYLFKKQTLEGKQDLSTGQFVGFASAFGLFISNSLSVLDTIFAGFKIRPLWKNAQSLVQQPLEVSSEKDKAPPLQGKVVLDHVSYRYSPNEELTLKDVTIQALPGEMIAVIGPSGAGKSTLVRLLLGFESPESGTITYDDKDLNEVDPRSIRSQVGTVLQNAALIAGSIYDNIVGSATFPAEAIDRAIHFSGFEEDLSHLPMGLNTIVPMGGGTFSGGQRQRLLLARALVSSPKILILDEATSALDNKTQDIVTHHLDRLHVTRIVIAHRLTTVKNADRIFVLENGHVVQVGTFKQLSAQQGLFLSMLKRQTL